MGLEEEMKTTERKDMKDCNGDGCSRPHCSAHGICDIFCGDILHVREPDPHHYHWGVQFWTDENPDCWALNQWISQVARERGFQGFHQGGYHQPVDKCSGRHYWEFWALYGGESYEDIIISFIREVEQKFHSEL